VKRFSPKDLTFYLSIWGFLFLSAILLLISLQAQISNSKQAKVFYDTLIATDEAGGDVETALRDLRSYIYSHMNTSIGNPNGIKPPIQLKATYDRLLDKQKAELETKNQAIYAEATDICEKKFPEGQLRSGRVQCVTDYVISKGVKVETIPDALYKFDFVSPRWSPDLAGYSLLASIVSFLIFFLRLFWHKRKRKQLHFSS
jgi:hypothetical protein